MAISELQIALIGAGTVAVVLVWAFNVWQERQHRKAADRIFKGGQGDALLPDETAAAAPSPDTDREQPAERLEPHFADAPAAVPDSEGDPATDSAAAEPAEIRDTAPPLPPDCADSIADCVLRLAAVEPIPAAALLAVRDAWAGESGKPMHLLAMNPGDSAWQPVGADATGRYRDWAVALQLVDRRGPVSDGELARFFDAVELVAQQTGAALELPPRAEVAGHAAALDGFCATVDIQFVLHVVEATGGAFAGTKLRGVAEAAGLVLEADGVFRARDAAGGEMFTVANLGTERLDAEALRSLATHGLTLSLDVPRVADGVAAFDRMLATAQQFSAALGGVLVDAQRAPLAEAMIAAIRAKTAELQARMNEAGIAPGGVRALRLFS